MRRRQLIAVFPKGCIASRSVLRVFRVDAACEQLSSVDDTGAFEPEHPENFIGRVRIIDLAQQAGLPGVDVLAVFFEPEARTKPHVHQTEQILYFVSGAGFVAFPGQDEQVVDEGGIVIVPACELHMHGATDAGPTCHVAARLPSKTNWKPYVPAEWRHFAEHH
jgi:quercetin dioxygenase-like cupin family protein